MRLYAQGIRFEVRGTGHKVIDSHWYKGTITFVSCDDSAHSFQSWAPGALTHAYAFNASGSRGPMVRYVDCTLMGYHQVTTASSAMTAGKILYDGSRLMNQKTLTGASGFLRVAGGITPRHEFRDCLTGGTSHGRPFRGRSNADMNT